MGVWIETFVTLTYDEEHLVTPCMGVWIETAVVIWLKYFITSHPVWVCGLKLISSTSVRVTFRHTLYGCVDWNLISKKESELGESHTLYGCVDWNLISKKESELGEKSHPVWVCGLKQIWYAI